MLYLKIYVILPYKHTKMKKYLIVLSILVTSFSSNADVLDNVSGKISKMAADLIPGEGVTEVSIDIEKNSEPKFDILAVRDIDKTESTNFFTQISFTNTDISDKERYIGNVGLGYRFLTEDKSMMIGFNSFYDHDKTEGHKRASVGFEASASTLEFNLNQYKQMDFQIPYYLKLWFGDDWIWGQYILNNKIIIVGITTVKTKPIPSTY